MNYLIILIISAIAQYFLPWWIIAPVSFAVGAWRSQSGKGAYLAAAGAVATLWIAYAAYLNISSGGLMLEKIGALFAESLKFLKNMPLTITFFAIMTIIGSQVAGLSATAGFHFKQLFK